MGKQINITNKQTIMLFVGHPKILKEHLVFSFSWGHLNSQARLKTMLLENFGVTNKEYYRMLWYFLEWSIVGKLSGCHKHW